VKLRFHIAVALIQKSLIEITGNLHQWT